MYQKGLSHDLFIPEVALFEYDIRTSDDAWQSEHFASKTLIGQRHNSSLRPNETTYLDNLQTSAVADSLL